MVYDRDVKARVYAQLGIREYWLADLNDNALACYSTPEAGAYRRVARFHRGESIAPQALPECAIDVDVLLPE
jgi:Uma2 family endonuclease